MLGKVALSSVRARREDFQYLSSIVANCQHLRILELINCHLDTACLKSLAEGLKGSNVQIDVLDVSFNRNLRKESLPYLHEICLRTRGLNYWQCGFKQIDLLTFDPAAEKVKTPILTRDKDIENLFKDHAIFDCSRDAIERHASTLRRLLQTPKNTESRVTARISGYESDSDIRDLQNLIESCSELCELEISECVFTGKQMTAIGDSLHGKLDTVNVFLSAGMKEDAWEALGEIVRNRETSTLLITACGLTAPKLERFSLSLLPNQLTKLDVSRNGEMDVACFEKIGSLVEQSGVKELVMAYCRLSSTSVRALERSMGKAKLRRFDVSGNTTMGVDGFSALGSIAENCFVEQLDMSECDPNGEHLRSLEASLENAKVVKMNVSRNSELRKEGGLEAVASIVKKTQLRELFMRQCALDSNALTTFKKTMGAEKIPRVDLGHYFMKDRPVTDEEVEVIVGLLDNVSEELTLNKWDLSEAQKRRLKRALRAFPTGKAPTIQLNRSTNMVLRQGDA